MGGCRKGENAIGTVQERLQVRESGGGVEVGFDGNEEDLRGKLGVGT